jgi:hypothetical protein
MSAWQVALIALEVGGCVHFTVYAVKARRRHVPIFVVLAAWSATLASLSVARMA